MLIIERRGSRIGGTHKVYTRAEADAAGIPYTRQWRTMADKQWALTDDGYVGQLVYSRTLGCNKDNRNTRFLHFSFGIATDRTKELRFRMLVRSMGHANGVPHDVRFLKDIRSRVFIYYFCYSVLTTGKVDYNRLGMMVSSGKRPWIRARIILNSPRVQAKIANTMKDILDKEGVSIESIIQDYQKIKRKATDEGKYKEAIQILERFEQLVGMPTKLPGKDELNLPGKSNGSLLTSGDLSERLSGMLAHQEDSMRLEEGVRHQSKVLSSTRVYDEEGNEVTRFEDRSDDVE